MQISITSKQIDLGDSLKGYVDENLSKVVLKYFEKPINVNVSFSREGDFIRADISVHPISGILVQGSAKNPDAYTAFDEANARISKQLSRYKERLTDYSKASSAEPVNFSVIKNEEEETLPEDTTPIIIAEMEKEIPLCTVSGAVMRMDLADAPALMFRNVSHGGLNMVYRRHDGNIGWIDPKTSK